MTATELVIVDGRAGADTPGGVELLVRRVGVVDGGPGMRIHAATAERTVDLARGAQDAVVLLQSEGGRDAGARDLVRACLGLGATVVELNVFALGLGDRPRHPNYLPAFLSWDGLNRHVLRSVAEGYRPRCEAVLLPNPLVHKITRRPTHPPGDAVRLLRIGRPDPIKWTRFEIEFGERLAIRRPDLRVQLRLIGVPQSLRPEPGSLPPNLEVDCQDYTPGVAEAYGWAHAYLHHSRIGETYGNTLLEANLSGLPVICALNPAWDCAPLEFLGQGSLLATPQVLLSRPEATLELLGSDVVPRRRDVSPADFVRRLLAAVRDPGNRVAAPSLPGALRYVYATAGRLGAKRRGGALAVGHETIRSTNRRVRGH